MRKTVLSGTVAIAALLGVPAAQAQIVSWEVTPEQERTIYTTIYQDRETVGAAPVREFDVDVGATVPAEIELYDVPDTITYIPAQRYRYVLQGNRVVFVEPGSRRVIRVIGP